MEGSAGTTLVNMVDVATALWGPGRRWTPGELAWAVLSQPDEPDVQFIGGGWAWRRADYVSILVESRSEAMVALEWAEGAPVQAIDGDDVLCRALKTCGYEEARTSPFDLDVRLQTRSVMPDAAAIGYRVRSARDGDDVVAVHQSSWRPADLPFAPRHQPEIEPAGVSSFSAELMARVASSPLHRQDLHVVVEAPDGALVGSCIAWFDAVNAVAAIEPLGVVPAHRRRGLAGGMCLHAARLANERGAREVIIHPRGDEAYPAPRGAYLRAGFSTVGRTRIFRR